MTEQERSRYKRWLKEIGRLLAEIRLRKGLTQRELASDLDYSKKFYRDVEQGRRPISTRTLFIIFSRMGIPLPLEEE